MKRLTEVVFILDRSGSMAGLESDTIGGFNSVLEKQKKLEGEVIVSTVLFNHKSQVLHDRIDIKQISVMTEKDYHASGCTALLDAVGDAIWHIRNVHKYVRDEDRPGKTLFIITTDGMENSSQRFGYDEIQKLIKEQKEQHGWEFLFLGANIDAVRVAGRMGIKKEYAANFVNDRKGIAVNYKALNAAVEECRRSSESGLHAPDFLKSWKTEIDIDFAERGNIKGKL